MIAPEFNPKIHAPRWSASGRTYEQVVCRVFAKLGAAWIHEGGAMIPWISRSWVVRGPVLHSNRIAEQAYSRLLDRIA